MSMRKPKPVLPKAKPTVSANVAAGRKPKDFSKVKVTPRNSRPSK
jgi:hypothetical protein